ncbi:hypothetical protein [Streptomyces sp. NPDC048663]|uniref:hypothetical protein n=1 Tax=Streptomyces sp. NPDC048663 TaxID=3155638 RepID=UPI00342BDC57
MDGAMTLYGLLAILAGSVTSVVLAVINRDRPDPPAEAVVEEVNDPDLTTVEGIARMVVRQGRRIRQLEVAQADAQDRIGAMSRYLHTLKQTIRQLGGSVPEPDPRDAHLIDRH